MQTPQQVIDTYYLETRCALLEIAATLDRYDAAVSRIGTAAARPEKLEVLRQALAQLADPTPTTDRAEKLLIHFATI